jgi:hypothetical protein
MIGGGTIGSDKGSSVFQGDNLLLYKPLFEVISLNTKPQNVTKLGITTLNNQT